MGNYAGDVHKNLMAVERLHRKGLADAEIAVFFIERNVDSFQRYFLCLLIVGRNRNNLIAMNLKDNQFWSANTGLDYIAGCKHHYLLIIRLQNHSPKRQRGTVITDDDSD
jgi:hypothetical protein